MVDSSLSPLDPKNVVRLEEVVPIEDAIVTTGPRVCGLPGDPGIEPEPPESPIEFQ